jgi:hypothetical protein
MAVNVTARDTRIRVKVRMIFIPGRFSLLVFYGFKVFGNLSDIFIFQYILI